MNNKMNKRKRTADGLLRGLQEAVKMEQGRLVGRERVRTLSKPAPSWSKYEIKRLRLTVFNMSQPVFASLLNVKPSTIRAWEQGQRTPDGTAARLLEILSNDHGLAEKLAS